MSVERQSVKWWRKSNNQTVPGLNLARPPRAAAHKERSKMSSADMKKPIQVHATTLPHLDLIEKIIFDELVKQGRAVVVADTPEATRCP